MSLLMARTSKIRNLYNGDISKIVACNSANAKSLTCRSVGDAFLRSLCCRQCTLVSCSEILMSLIIMSDTIEQ